MQNHDRVSTAEGQELATQLGFKFLETSSKRNEGGVDDAFLALTDDIYRRFARRPLHDARAGGGTLVLGPGGTETIPTSNVCPQCVLL